VILSQAAPSRGYRFPVRFARRARAFLCEVCVFDFDIGRMVVGLLVFGVLVGGAIVALILLAWPWLWAMAKPALDSWTT